MPPGDFLEEHPEAELAVQALLGVLLDVAPAEEGGSFADCWVCADPAEASTDPSWSFGAGMTLQ